MPSTRDKISELCRTLKKAHRVDEITGAAASFVQTEGQGMGATDLALAVRRAFFATSAAKRNTMVDAYVKSAKLRLSALGNGLDLEFIMTATKSEWRRADEEQGGEDTLVALDEEESSISRQELILALLPHVEKDGEFSVALSGFRATGVQRDELNARRNEIRGKKERCKGVILADDGQLWEEWIDARSGRLYYVGADGKPTCGFTC